MKLLSNTQTIFIAFYRKYLAKTTNSQLLVPRPWNAWSRRPHALLELRGWCSMSLCGCMDPYLCTAESSFGLRYLSISIKNQVAVLPQLWSVAKNWNDIGRICCSFGCFISISCICNLNITMKSDWSPIIILPYIIYLYIYTYILPISPIFIRT